MNTVDALNVLGKALCGDSFETKPGLTDAETILEIAKQYEAPEGGGSGGGGSFTPRIIDFYQTGATTIEYEAGLTAEDFIGAVVKHPTPDPSNPTSASSMIPALVEVIGIVDLGETMALVFNNIEGGTTHVLTYNPETGVIAQA